MKMNTESIKSESIKLLDFLDGLSNLTWRKFQDRYPESWNGTTFQEIDQSAFPPFFSFRFKSESADLINGLKEAVTSYTGKVEWIMVGHERDPLPGINWIICPNGIGICGMKRKGLDYPAASTWPTMSRNLAR